MANAVDSPYFLLPQESSVVAPDLAMYMVCDKELILM